MENKINRMKELLEIMKKEELAYYLYDCPIVTDREWDAQFDELSALEAETGIVFATSPTQKVGGAVLSGLEKVRHSKPMLSAAKVKNTSEVAAFSAKGNCNCVLSWKLDGLTLVLRYKGGKLDKVITRGDGDVGEDVTHNRASVLGIPECIPCKEYVEVRGECVISWAGFEEINKRIEDPYSHPRNLAAGSIRLLNQKESSSRELQFVAFELVYPEVKTVMDSYQFL